MFRGPQSEETLAMCLLTYLSMAVSCLTATCTNAPPPILSMFGVFIRVPLDRGHSGWAVSQNGSFNPHPTGYIIYPQ